MMRYLRFPICLLVAVAFYSFCDLVVLRQANAQECESFETYIERVSTLPSYVSSRPLTPDEFKRLIEMGRKADSDFSPSWTSAVMIETADGLFGVLVLLTNDQICDRPLPLPKPVWEDLKLKLLGISS